MTQQHSSNEAQCELLTRVRRVGKRDQQIRLARNLAYIWLILAVFGVGMLIYPQMQPWHYPICVAVFAALTLFTSLAVWLRCNKPTNDIQSARMIEATYCELHDELLAAVEHSLQMVNHKRSQTATDPHPAPIHNGYLQQRIVEETLEHSRHKPWHEAVPTKLLRAAGWRLSLTGILLIVIIGVGIIKAGPYETPTHFPASKSPVQQVTDAQIANTMTVEPGDVTIERGTSLVVLARFSHHIPANAQLIITNSQNNTRTLPMQRSLDDMLVAARIANVATNLTYRIVHDETDANQAREDQTTIVNDDDDSAGKTYTVTVFEYPQLLQADATLTYPAYTSKSKETIPDTRRLSAVEGTTLLWACNLNKPVASATLHLVKGSNVQRSASQDSTPPSQPAQLHLTPNSTIPSQMLASFIVTTSARYRLELIDEAGRRNRHQPEFVINAIPNRPPTIKLVSPRKDMRVSPLEEMQLKVAASDDFGLTKLGLTYQIPGQPQTHIDLTGNNPKQATVRSKIQAAHVLALETLNAVPDQLVSYYFWAQDISPAGTPRKTYSDMFFAEVRPFEEIFRQGDQPPGNPKKKQNKKGNEVTKKAEELLKEQKQIILATWNILRRETSDQVSSQFAADVAVVHDAQTQALTKAQALAQKVKDAKSKKHIAEAIKQMANAASALTLAAESKDSASLSQALQPEQAALQSLLALRAREHQVIKKQQQQQQSQSKKQSQSQRQQQQLQQLKLDEKKNRYETQRQADEQKEEPAKRETRQVLSRLRDLARRQDDLNKKLKELELALKEAREQKQKEELEKQLERLRDQQRDMLRDLDEVKERMEKSESKQQMVDAKKQVDQARQSARKASEALKKGMTSQAINEGTRAQRQLQQLRDDFRKKAANQFEDDVTNLRQDANQLADKQNQLSKQLDKLNKAGPQTLRDKEERKQVTQGLNDQKDKLDDLLKQMRKTSEAAESPEPLLSKHLYDTLRKADKTKVDQSLELASNLLNKGFNKEADQVQKQAQSGIEDIRKGVEKAAESVIGDETQALRRAREALDKLAKSVESEANKNDPTGKPQDKQNNKQNSKPSNSNSNNKQNPGKSDPKQQTKQQVKQQQQGPQNKNGKPGQSTNNKQDNQTPDSKQTAQQANSKQPNPKQNGTPKPSNKPNDNQSPPTKPASNQQNANSSKPSSADNPDKRSTPKNNPLNFLEQQQHKQNQTAGSGGSHNPITGEDYREWSDQLRDVEELLSDPKLREKVAQIRDRARSARADFKKHGKQPNWDLVRSLIADPLTQIRDQVADELLRKQAKDKLVPIDRDPVPNEFENLVREYYKKLGTGNPSKKR